MTENFSPITLVYEITSDVHLSMELSSINFGINHVTIGSNIPFTSELSFNLRIMNEGSKGFSSFDDLQRILGIKKTNDPQQDVTAHLKSEIKKILEVTYSDLRTGAGKYTSPVTECLVISINPQQTDIFSCTWQVVMKFISSISTDKSIVCYPEFIISKSLLSSISDLKGFQEFNDTIKIGHEILVTDKTSPDSTVGKAAGEVTESIEKLADSLASTLKGPFKTQLQRTGGVFTDDIALWALIRKSTDALSFDKYMGYMEEIFCGVNNNLANTHPAAKQVVQQLYDKRRSPFMRIDSYQAVKVATEAFLMVNCGVKRFDQSDIDDIKENVRIINGEVNWDDLNKYYEEKYMQQTGLEDKFGTKAKTIPYLKVISEKLGSSGIKSTSFDDALKIFTGVNTGTVDNCYGIIRQKLESPCFLELIWSYWHEESMMVQGLNAICRRFQNIRSTTGPDPLVNLQIDPLRPLNNLLWGYVQDYQHRLTVRRRAYEYSQQYNLSLAGNATRDMRYADPRSKFIEAFHTLLKITSSFYLKADDVTVVPDGFPVLNGLRETHLILSEGAGNQYGDLPSTSRAEMLMEQWLLARPEFREFLPSRSMVAYPEAWMGPVSTLNQMLGFSNTSVLHFNYLAIYGEKILLAIRFGNWADPAVSPNAAANWAHFWRKEIQGYIHAYRAVTGVDLSADNGPQRIDSVQPSVHLHRRLIEQKRGAANTRAAREIAI